jgi:hypothetical protein
MLPVAVAVCIADTNAITDLKALPDGASGKLIVIVVSAVSVLSTIDANTGIAYSTVLSLVAILCLLYY